MKEPIIIAEGIFGDLKDVFNQEENLKWVPSAAEEPVMADAIRKAGARIAVLGTVRYTGELYQALNKSGPALITRFGVGYDSLDLDQCREKDIAVTITPGTLDQSVAEQAIALLLSAARHIPRLDNSMRTGSFSRIIGFELKGKTLGIAGFGHIGKQVALIASHGFGMKISALDIQPLSKQAADSSEEDFLKRYGIQSYHTDFEAFAGSTAIVSIHLPLNDETRGYFNEKRLNALLPGTVLINTGRGPLIDETALFKALKGEHLALAALDVFTHEPYQPVHPDMDLRTLPNVVLSPHAASHTTEARRRMAERVLHNIRAFRDHRSGEMDRVI